MMLFKNNTAINLPNLFEIQTYKQHNEPWESISRHGESFSFRCIIAFKGGILLVVTTRQDLHMVYLYNCQAHKKLRIICKFKREWPNRFEDFINNNRFKYNSDN
ncbi:hypothetical protein ACTFIU_011289 [Dictyostelium citrinum]